MKLITDNKVYDTDTSDELATAVVMEGSEESSTETLYKSRKGQLFIVCTIAYASWETPDDHSMRLVTSDQAHEWLLNNEIKYARPYEVLGVELEEARSTNAWP